MENTYLRFENQKYEIVKIDTKYIVKDKKNKIYYEKISLPNTVPFLLVKSKITNKQLIVYITVFTLLVFLNFVYFFIDSEREECSGKVFMMFFSLYSFLQVVLHECGHYVAFRFFGRKIDKIGVKFNYIFPSFFIRMNDIYMISRQEKIIVHSLGLFINYFINLIVLIIASVVGNLVFIKNIALFFLFALLMNTLPILNSDGYKIMLVFLNYNEKKFHKRNKLIIKVIVLINVILSIWYIINIWKG